MDFYQNIAYSSKPGTINRLLKKYNRPPVQNQAEAEYELKLLVNKNGEAALYDVANLHPDKEVILKAQKNEFLAAGGTADCPTCKRGVDGSGGKAKKPSFNFKEYLNKNSGVVTAIAVGVVLVFVLPRLKN